MKYPHVFLAATFSFVAAPFFAEESREMDAHVHGISGLEMALEGDHLEMNLNSPGMDIVGFEHAPNSAEDKAAVAKAIRMMVVPENVVTLPDAAACHLSEVLVHRHSDTHVEDDAEGHAEHDHEHEKNEHAHAEDKDHDHEDGAQHSVFHTRYAFDCDNPQALTKIDFPFFKGFENAKEIDVKFVTDLGAGSAGSVKITLDSTELTLN